MRNEHHKTYLPVAIKLCLMIVRFNLVKAPTFYCAIVYSKNRPRLADYAGKVIAVQTRKLPEMENYPCKCIMLNA